MGWRPDEKLLELVYWQDNQDNMKINFLLAAFTAIMFTTFQSCGQDKKEVTTPSGLQYTVIKTGIGPTAKSGNEVAIYESVSYLSGKLIYKIERPAPPIKFTIGKKDVIAGVEEAVTGMQVGEIKRLIIPPHLSKRESYPDILSKDSTLLYHVELVEIVKQ